MKKNFLALLVILLITTIVHAQHEGADKRFLARAGEVFISEAEFLQRFELLPGLYRHRKPQLQQAKLDLLISMIAEKLLAQEARRRNLELDSLYDNALLDVRKLLARDELYHREVAEKVTVSKSEIDTGIRKALRQVLLDFYFFEREEDALFVRSGMQESADFFTVVVDSSIDFVRDTATVVWGDAEPAIEQAAYQLKVGEISPVVRAGEGFYILRCVSNLPNTFYGSMQPAVLRERIASRIRARKEHARMLETIPKLLEGREAYSRPLPLKRMSDALASSLLLQPATEDSLVYVNKSVHARAYAECASFWADTVTVAGNIAWTVQDVLDKLMIQGFRIRRSDVRNLPRLINTELEYRAQQELISQEGIRRGLDESPLVKNRLAVWQSAYLADVLKRYAHDRVTISDAEVFAYMNSRDPSLQIPMVRIRELRTLSLDAMSPALAALESGDSFEDVAGQFNADALLRLNKGVSELFPITDRQPIGDIASQMDIGQRYGPLRLKDHVVYFELLEKKIPEADGSLITRKEEAGRELLEMKKRRFVSLLIAQLAGERGYEIYQDRLMKLEVSSVPMLVYRMLGFGGRMFEVPFVEPQLDWIDIEPPKETILP